MLVNENGGGVEIFSNDGTGVFTDSGQSLGSSSDDFQTVALGDVDGDGDLDAVVSNEGERPDRVFLNDGLGVFTDSGQALGDADSQHLTLGDVDGDGDLDIVVANDDEPSRVYLLK